MSEASNVPTDPYIGQVIQGRYQVLKVLGTGGMGAVYLAEQISIGRRVALKVLRRDVTLDQAFVRRFHHEARLAGVINHPRVVTIYDFGEIGDGNLFLVMEYVSGETLRTFIQQQRTLSVPRAVAIALQIAEALQAVHQAGVLHRDIKPENVVVRAGDEIKLMDFGIARQLDVPTQEKLTRLTQTGMLIGSPQYMAPEQIDGRTEISERTDIYAWGAILYELLTGVAAFAAPTWQAVLLKHLQELPQPLRQQRPEVPSELEYIVMQSLAKEPEQRQQNMGEVIAALRKVKWQISIQRKPRLQEEPTQVEVNPPRRFRGLQMVGMIAVGVVLMGAVVLGTRGLPINLPSLRPTNPAGVSKSTKPEEDDTRRKVKDHLSTAAFYMERGQIEEAKAEFAAALALDPDNQEARTGLNQANRATKIDEATLRKVRDLLETAKFYLERGQEDAAKDELEAARKLDPNNPEVSTMLARIQTGNRRRR